MSTIGYMARRVCGARDAGRWARWLSLCALLALAMTACSAPGITTAHPHSEPLQSANGVSFTQGACQFSVARPFVAGKSVICGDLVTRANHADPKSASIQVAVAILKSQNAHPAPDPIIFLQGGPGGGSIRDFAAYYAGGQAQTSLEQQFGPHDVIFVDQRGTGYSKPSLQCPEVVNLTFQTDQTLTPQQANDAQNKALTTCHARLVGQGVNLSDYTTYADAADIHDLIMALGYSQVNLYGVSYGTRLALEVMRSFPQRVRSVVLDSTVPAQLKLLASVPSDTARVFDTLFKGCAADAACNQQYPHLDAVFYALYAKLNAHPITFQAQDLTTSKRYTVLFKGDDLVNVTFTAFYLTEAIALLPKMLYAVNAGDTSLLATLYGALILSDADSVSWGMYYSVECAEDVNGETTQALEQAGQAYPAAIRADQVIGLEGELDGCKLWNVPSAPAAEAQPVSSGLPTLVFEDEYDPITPPANGQQAAQTLAHSYQFTFPGLGHGALLSGPGAQECPVQIAVAFWSHPDTQPDGGCVTSMREPAFS